MAWVRRVRTASGAAAVQVAESVGGRRRIVAHVGSAHTEAELGLLLERARELLTDPGQGQFELGVQPSRPVVALVADQAAALLPEPVGTLRSERAKAPRALGPLRGCCSTCWLTCTPAWV